MGVVYEAFDRERDDAGRAQDAAPARRRAASIASSTSSAPSRTSQHPNLVTLHELIRRRRGSGSSRWSWSRASTSSTHGARGPRQPPTRALPGHAATADEPRLARTDRPDWPARRLDAAARGAPPAGRGRDRAARRGQAAPRLKPSNVLVTDEGRVVLLDFGLVADVARSRRGDRRRPASSAPPRTWRPSRPRRGASTEAERLVRGRRDALRGADRAAARSTARRCRCWSAKQRVETRRRPSELVAAACPTISTRCAWRCSAAIRASGPTAATSCAALGRAAAGRHRRRAARRTGPFVGRDRELAALRAALRGRRRAAARWPCSCTAGRAWARARWCATSSTTLRASDAARALPGRCYERESVPYKALDSVDRRARAGTCCGCPAPRPTRCCRRDVGRAGARVPGAAPASMRSASAPARRRDPRPAASCAGAPSARCASCSRRLGDRAAAGPLHRRPAVGRRRQRGAPRRAARGRPIRPALLLIACYRSEYADAEPVPGAHSTAARTRPPDVRRRGRTAPVRRGAPSWRSAAARRIVEPATGTADAHRARVRAATRIFVYELARQLACAVDREPDLPARQLDLDEVLWQRVRALPSDGAAPAGGRGRGGQAALAAERLRGSGARPAVVECGCHPARGTAHPTAPAPRIDDAVETYHDRIRESVVAPRQRRCAVEHHRRLALALEAASHRRPRGHGRAFPACAGLVAEARAITTRSPPTRRRPRSHSTARPSSTAWPSSSAATSAARRGSGSQPQARRRSGQRGPRVRSRPGLPAGRGGRGRAQVVELAAAGRLPVTASAATSTKAGRPSRPCWPGSACTCRARGDRRWSRCSAAAAPAPARPAPFSERQRGRRARPELERVDIFWSVAAGMTHRRSDSRRGVPDLRPDAGAARGGALPRRARAGLGGGAHLHDGHPAEGAGRTQLATAEMLARPAQPARTPAAWCGWRAASRPTSKATSCSAASRARRPRRSFATSARACPGSWRPATRLHCGRSTSAGAYAELSHRTRRCWPRSAERGARLAEADLTTLGGPFVWLAADDPDGAARAVASAMGEWSHQDFQVQHFTTLTAEAQIDLYRGDGRAAWGAFESQWAGLADAMLLHVEIVRVYMLTFAPAARWRRWTRLDREPSCWAPPRATPIGSSASGRLTPRRWRARSGLRWPPSAGTATRPWG